MFEHEVWGAWIKLGYTLLAACAGAITALSFLKWEKMRWSEIVVTLMVGFSFAVFVTPLIAVAVIGHDPSAQVQAGLTYVMGCGVNSILPPIIRKIRRIVGADEGGGA